jgi:hypothetical protein
MSSIVNLLNQIKQQEIVLPAIQRDFVWPKEKVLRLLDSIMRGYPIGIALLWDTYLDLQYRTFSDAFHPSEIHDFKDNTRRKKLKLVLDGQQRLQSLYVALYGSYEGKSLYFDVLSGRESDDLAEEKYEFEFLDKEGFERWKEQIQARASAPIASDKDEPQYLIKVADLFAAGVRGRDALARRIKQQMTLAEDDEARLSENMARFHDALALNTNILKVSVIDENLTADNPDRKSEADVLEIFVRVNREGTPLSRSDLIFSMLKLNWRESAETLPKFVRQINEGNTFELDTDFVIRCLFAVSDLGTKFELDLLRKKNNVDRLRRNFQACCDAIRSVVDTVSRDCWCASSNLLGGQNTLVPFVYYLFHTPKHEVPKGQIDNFRKALYVFAFSRPFSRYADSRLWKFIRDEIRPLAEKKDYRFPFDRAVAWVHYWEVVTGFNQRLLQSNVGLTLHVLQDIRADKIHYERNAGQSAHIFPRAELRKKGFEESEINHFGNFWILAKGRNQNKSDKHPAKFFADISDNEMRRAFIDRDMLDYRRFRTFVKDRSEKITDVVGKRLGFSDGDFGESQIRAEGKEDPALAGQTLSLH